eukprot:Lankesteria_metandrocarpae@DN5262_c0_g2_i2.p1
MHLLFGGIADCGCALAPGSETRVGICWRGGKPSSDLLFAPFLSFSQTPCLTHKSFYPEISRIQRYRRFSCLNGKRQRYQGYVRAPSPKQTPVAKPEFDNICNTVRCVLRPSLYIWLYKNCSLAQL